MLQLFETTTFLCVSVNTSMSLLLFPRFLTVLWDSILIDCNYISQGKMNQVSTVNMRSRQEYVNVNTVVLLTVEAST